MYGKKTGTKHSNFDLGPALNIPKERSVKGGCPSVGVSECACVCVKELQGRADWTNVGEARETQTSSAVWVLRATHTHTRKTHKYTLIILLPQLFRRHRT